MRDFLNIRTLGLVTGVFLVLGLGESLRAQTSWAVTVPQGYLMVTCPAGSVTAPSVTTFSLPLSSTVPSTFVGLATGQIASVGSNTISIDSTGTGTWSPGALSQAATPYFIRITSGVSCGQTFQISTTTANTANMVTILNQGLDLTSASEGIATAASSTTPDTFQIFPGETLNTFFGTSTMGSDAAATADVVELYSGGLWNDYYFNTNSSMWQKGSVPVDQGPVVLRPDSGITFYRRGGTQLCIHVMGAAMLFRRLYPRESPWFCFLVPILGLLITLNFIEHFIALSNLGWLLPLTLGGLLWAILKPGYSWKGIRFPAILFVGLFTFIFALKCIGPEISNTNEGISNLVRVLDYCLGGTLPPTDSFLPPYDYGSYYSFQHYGAAILKRLFSVDLGTAYNVGFAFLLAWLCLTGAGVAHAITGKVWIAMVTVIILLSGSTGSVPLIILFGHHGPDYALSTNLNDDWNNPDRNPFSWICAFDKEHPGLLLQPPMINLYWSEFHSTLGGNFVTLASVLAAVEVFKVERNNWPWIGLIVLPMIIVITSAWFIFIVGFVCAGSLILAWTTGRRPENIKFVGIASGIAIILLWPFVFTVTGTSAPAEFRWTPPEEHTPLWMFVVQWWPIYIPWIYLCFIWYRLDLRARWFHAVFPILFIAVELFTFGDRKLTTEKMWAGIYGVGLVTLLPLVFIQKKKAFILLTALFSLNGVVGLGAALNQYYGNPFTGHDFFQLSGDAWVLGDAQKKRILQVLRRLHGATILPGKSYWNYSQAAAVVSFSENRCYVAYTFTEELYGHGPETEYRNRINNEFYEGKVANPLPFLSGNKIAAVLIWPEDAVSDQLLQQYQDQLGPEFFYVDCKMDGPNNAGVFMRQSALKDDPAKSAAALGLNIHP